MYARTMGLCNSHTIRCRDLFGRIDPADVPLFLARSDVRPFPSWGPCRVVACLRLAYNGVGLCLLHSQRWHETLRSDVDADLAEWCRREDGVTVSGVANLRGLPRPIVLEFLGGLQLRAGQGRKTRPSQANRLARAARHQQVASLRDINLDGLGEDVKSLVALLVRDVDRATTTPGEEQRKDHWDLAVLGSVGRIDFTILTQPWLREVAKHWASEDLARRRGDSAGMVVRTHIGSLAELSTTLRLTRVDHGLNPTALGRPDIVAFLTRLGHLEQTEAISANRRYQVVRHVRTVLRDARDLGMTRPDGCAAGLPGEFGVRPEDVPPPAHVDGPGRALPNEVMNVLNDALPLLETRSGRSSRVAVEVLMDTGRRPDQVCQLPLDCLDRDGDGKYVLIYTDYKENRLQRRLPIPDSTAALIRGQQAAVREAFPAADPRHLVLIPAASANPQGTKSLRATGLTNLHRGWVDQLPEFRLTDGGIFPHAAVVAYAYRHTYAQRHADAGTPIEVLRELMGHRSVHSTEAYYRITEVRTRAAVTRVADHQFDGSGNRVWRQVAVLLDSERARMRVGQVAVPYGTCTEPSNVQAGGSACPFRFRCLGCGHFRTDVSYLPELRAHLDRLLADRERVIAATELEPWARTEAVPSDTEIEKVRALIRQLDDHVDDLTPAERDQITEAIGVLRTTRQAVVHLGMPIAPPASGDPRDVRPAGR
ncbi:site-specific integrase [Kribbella sp. NPDC051718]|uniref:tyrosine-type recombinase/integrase n=1 Tax=Kribbella sp. NPDC051718 TaxID=3155168 RepID=UPI0034472A7A